jgi:hypothetical protein
MQQPRAGKDWWVAPVSRAPNNKYLLAIQLVGGERRFSLPQLEGITRYVDLIGQMVAQRSSAERRSQRLRSMLEMTTRWNQSRETETLLEEMATTS